MRLLKRILITLNLILAYNYDNIIVFYNKNFLYLPLILKDKLIFIKILILTLNFPQKTPLSMLDMIESMKVTYIISFVMTKYTEVTTTSMFMTSLKKNLYGPLVPPRFQLLSGTFPVRRVVPRLLVYHIHLEYHLVPP